METQCLYAVEEIPLYELENNGIQPVYLGLNFFVDCFLYHHVGVFYLKKKT